MHALADAAGGGIERLQLILRLLKAFLRLLIFGVDNLRLLMQLIERRHPGRNFLHLELIAQPEVLLCRLRLLFQRADLHFQLLYLVINAQEVFFRLFKLALRFLFSVAVAGDTGGFLKDLAPVGRAARNYLAYPALADDGIPIASKAGVHEKVVDILEAHGFAVDVVFALAAAVIAAGQHYLTAVGIEDVA